MKKLAWYHPILQDVKYSKHLSYFLFFIYVTAACWLLYKSSFIRSTGFPFSYIVFFFFLKTASGCYYGYWYGKPENIATADTWRFHFAGLEEYHLLFNKPGKYFTNLFSNGYNTWTGFFSPQGYWNDLKDNLMQKIISLMDVFSGGYYYVNVVIYSCITLFGFAFLYLSLKNILHKTPSLLTTGILLLTPSCLFWTSGLHRDGFVLLFTGLCFWYGTRILNSRKINPKHLLVLIVSFLALSAFRNYVAVLLICPFAGWLIGNKYRIKNYIIFPVTALFCIVIFFSSAVIHPAVSIPAKLIERKTSFEQLEGNSRMAKIELRPSFISFAKNLPRVIDRSFFRPHVWEAKKSMEIVASVEVIMAVAVILLAFFRPKYATIDEDARSFQWMVAFFCISNMLVIGYVVPFAGAIVRYRALFLMLLLVISSFSIEKKNVIAGPGG